ncbi:SIMPL domain-containing protein [Flammeovirgaceae bacterium SG7u.111]|nr:SIMPL domain-containing protein [Flammeovirgaceae bacterium SG7u.132]WPO36778.1 SIMPL domain-containing protein [Flammeovirgaceae bacterium SG7u.111]
MKTLFALALVLLPTLLFGQISEENTKINPYIEVTGTAEQKVVPDQIYISINLKEREEGKVKITIEKQENDLKKALGEINVPLEDLSLSDANAEFVKIKWKKKDVIASNNYLLKVGDAVTVGKVFEKLDELKIEDAYIAKVHHSKMDSLNKEVKILAIKAAKNKAEYLLEAIGENLGKPQIIRETSGGINYQANMMLQEQIVQYSGSAQRYRSDDKLDNDIEFQKIVLKSSVYIKFGIL